MSPHNSHGRLIDHLSNADPSRYAPAIAGALTATIGDRFSDKLLDVTGTTRSAFNQKAVAEALKNVRDSRFDEDMVKVDPQQSLEILSEKIVRITAVTLAISLLGGLPGDGRE